MKKQAYYINERTQHKFNDGSFLLVNDRVTLDGKPGTITGSSYNNVSVKFDDGTGLDHIDPYRLMKIAKHTKKIMTEFSLIALKN